METYKDKCEQLKDSQPTIYFIKQIHSIIKAMSSRTPVDALRSDDACKTKVFFSILCFDVLNLNYI